MFLATGCSTKSAIVFPSSLNIRSSQKINKESRKGNIPVIGLSTLIEPAPLAAEKSVGA